VSEVASQLKEIPSHLEEVAQHELSTGAHMALVTVGVIYIGLDISTIMGKRADTDHLVVSTLQQWAMKPVEAIISKVDPSLIIKNSMLNLSEGSSDA
jgi:hypothetical protein